MGVSVDRLSEVNRFVVVGSIDGVAAASAYIRALRKDPNTIKIDFTEAFRVHQLKPQEWDPNTKVGFIDLGVNNDGKKSKDRGPEEKDPKQMTIDFVNEINNAGHKIIFIADEHGSKKWEKVLVKCGLDINLLEIKPQDRGNTYPSSCAILQEALNGHLDEATLEILDAGTQADLPQKGTSTRIGEIFRKAIKSNILDDKRRDYLARHFSQNLDPDATILGWMKEYEVMEDNLVKIMQTREDLKDGIMRYTISNLKHDATEFFKEAYKNSPVVVLANTPVFINNVRQTGISMAIDDSKEGIKNLNVVNILKNAGIQAGGFAAKANFATSDMDPAIEAMRACVKEM
jgi:hypothetical protein